MLSQASFITPYARVVYDNRIVDTVLGIVDFRRAVGVDNLNWVTVTYDLAVFFINANSAFERAVNGVAT